AESEDDRDAPWPRLPQARRALADRARSSALERGRSHRSPGTKPGVTLAPTAPSAVCGGGRHADGVHRREIPNPAGGFARGDLRAPRPSVEAVINRPKGVTKMLSKASLRRLITTGLVLGVLAAATPAAGLAQNVGGGGGVPVGRTK